ncbi:hypothetical protein B566_EDAN007105 [Ephemera danica]|nr:hypothetical protein B566_EDAN007105 [Ephemera danica]
MSGTPSGMQSSQAEALALAGATLERHLAAETGYPSLLDVTKVSPQCLQTASGLNNLDYMRLDSLIPGLDVAQVQTVSRVMLPREVTEHARASHFHSLRGLFPEIRRAWITIDSDLYVWTYEQSADTAYYDRLTETIVSVALIRPRKGVFQSFVRHLLVLSTAVEVVVLGVTYQHGPHGHELISLLPEPVYQLPADGIVVSATLGTPCGRIFQGAEDGCLYEITYQGNEGWFGKSCRRVNHSQGTLSFLVPSFLSFSERDGISQLELDPSRNLLYALTKRGAVRAYQLGENPGEVTLLATVSERSESPQLHLVAVTSAGVRLYFTTLPWNALTPPSPVTSVTPGGPVMQTAPWHLASPQCLSLVHVRLPPGYTAQAHMQPQNVYKVHYHRGTCLMVSRAGERSSVLCLSRDLHPATPYFAETETQLTTDTEVFALEEVPSRPPTGVQGPLGAQPPLVVTQHMEHPAKFITLTAQGVQIHSKLRPSDVLRAALLSPHGPESPAARAFFNFLGDEQACALALQLACMDGTSNSVLADAATRAFLHGASPSSSTSSAAAVNSPITFAPSNVSTPISSIRPQGQSTMSSQHHSARHEGLCLYLSRVLRPVWNSRPASLIVTDNKHEILVSGADVEILAAVCTYLQTEERRSLIALRQLTGHALEVLGLWRVLCEHQFHVLAGKLSAEQRSRLCGISFKELILSGTELCLTLITTLVSAYLEDNASVDAVSAKLREVCPSLFRQEDAASAKAREILLRAKDEKDNGERTRLLTAALQLLQEAAPLVNLTEASQQLAACNFHEGVVRLSVHCARALDPNEMALKYFVSGEPAGDAAGSQAYSRRMDCYKEIINSLNRLFAQDGDIQQGRILLCNSLASDEHLLRVAVFEWLVRRGLLQSELLQRSDILVNTVGAPEATTLEGFLDRLAARQPGDSGVAELLWTLYENTGRHLAAAQILQRVAQSPGELVPIETRNFCLSRAILCMRADTVGYSKATGQITRDIEDLFDITRLQMRVLETVRTGKHSLSPSQLSRLSHSLLSLTELYQDYAVPLQLHESQLDILGAANSDESERALQVWQDMMENADRLPSLLERVTAVGRRHGNSEILFPLPFIVRELELHACRGRAVPGLVHRALLECNIPIPVLVEAYDRLLGQSEWIWSHAGNELHLTDTLELLVRDLLGMPPPALNAGGVGGPQQRREMLAACTDLVTKCLTSLYTKTEQQARIQSFRELQRECERMARS